MDNGVSLAYERTHERRAQGRGHAYDEGFMMERLLAGEYLREEEETHAGGKAT